MSRIDNCWSFCSDNSDSMSSPLNVNTDNISTSLYAHISYDKYWEYSHPDFAWNYSSLKEMGKWILTNRWHWLVITQAFPIVGSLVFIQPSEELNYVAIGLSESWKLPAVIGSVGSNIILPGYFVASEIQNIMLYLDPFFKTKGLSIQNSPSNYHRKKKYGLLAWLAIKGLFYYGLYNLATSYPLAELGEHDKIISNPKFALTLQLVNYFAMNIASSKELFGWIESGIESLTYTFNLLNLNWNRYSYAEAKDYVFSQEKAKELLMHTTAERMREALQRAQARLEAKLSDKAISYGSSGFRYNRNSYKDGHALLKKMLTEIEDLNKAEEPYFDWFKNHPRANKIKNMFLWMLTKSLYLLHFFFMEISLVGFYNSTWNGVLGLGLGALSKQDAAAYFTTPFIMSNFIVLSLKISIDIHQGVCALIADIWDRYKRRRQGEKISLLPLPKGLAHAHDSAWYVYWVSFTIASGFAALSWPTTLELFRQALGKDPNYTGQAFFEFMNSDKQVLWLTVNQLWRYVTIGYTFYFNVYSVPMVIANVISFVYARILSVILGDNETDAKTPYYHLYAMLSETGTYVRSLLMLTDESLLVVAKNLVPMESEQAKPVPQQTLEERITGLLDSRQITNTDAALLHQFCKDTEQQFSDNEKSDIIGFIESGTSIQEIIKAARLAVPTHPPLSSSTDDKSRTLERETKSESDHLDDEEDASLSPRRESVEIELAVFQKACKAFISNKEQTSVGDHIVTVQEESKETHHIFTPTQLAFFKGGTAKQTGRFFNFNVSDIDIEEKSCQASEDTEADCLSVFSRKLPACASAA